MSDDQRIREAAQRTYDRARSAGADHATAKRHVDRAAETVARQIDRGERQYPTK